MVNRKVLVLSRHGEAPQKPGGGSIDSLAPETVTDLYTRVGCPLQAYIAEEGVTADRTFIHHSPAVRTKYTGQAIVVGALNLQPVQGQNPPRSIDDLSRYECAHIAMYEDRRLFFGKPYINMDVYNTNNAVAAGNVNYWLAHPEATTHDGVQIESYKSVEARVRAATKDAVRRVVDDEFYFGVLVSHAGLVETVAATLIGTTQPVKSCKDIGGGFAMAQGAKLVIDRVGGPHIFMDVAYVEREGQIYPVDLEKLR